MPTKISNVKNDELYRVVLRRPVRVGRTLLRPGSDATMKGSVIKEHENDIESFSPVSH
jgi:nucleosome binding factor SPN SPT16 subunit